MACYPASRCGAVIWLVSDDRYGDHCATQSRSAANKCGICLTERRNEACGVGDLRCIESGKRTSAQAVCQRRCEQRRGQVAISGRGQFATYSGDWQCCVHLGCSAATAKWNGTQGSTWFLGHGSAGIWAQISDISRRRTRSV